MPWRICYSGSGPFDRVSGARVEWHEADETNARVADDVHDGWGALLVDRVHPHPAAQRLPGEPETRRDRKRQGDPGEAEQAEHHRGDAVRGAHHPLAA